MTTQVLLQLTPALKIPHVETFKITLRGQNPTPTLCLDEQTSSPLSLFQPRVHKLTPPRTHHRMATLDSSLLRKKVGHAAIMVACARHRFKVRRAALQAASHARLFNFTGEWGLDL
ncbi:SubName: Full=Uncharacterized protein {ECO:0000313/EMBL:CCA74833.1} [Serendipita indica DSM 11827]|nr:SubName: Full=Uncharacterized protein {ECO:0000313/EMBL:CCA74833.1} [Serendipita indica DSM 11827]